MPTRLRTSSVAVTQNPRDQANVDCVRTPALSAAERRVYPDHQDIGDDEDQAEPRGKLLALRCGIRWLSAHGCRSRRPSKTPLKPVERSRDDPANDTAKDHAPVIDLAHYSSLGKLNWREYTHTAE